MDMIKSLWIYREFIFGSVRREFQSKYRNSMMGIAWVILNPLAMILVYTVIFSQVMRAKLPGMDSPLAYGIFLCAGMLSWSLFTEIVSKSLNVFLDNANILKKLNFPWICLPAIVVISAGLNFFITFTLFTIILIVFGSFPGVAYLAIFPLVVTIALFGIGLGITLGVLNVFFRDVGQFFAIFLQFWFWLTPIVYPIEAIPLIIQKIVYWNPMTSIIQGFQSALGRGEWPTWDSLWFPACVTFFFLILGLSLFRRHSGEMVDEL